MNLKDTISMMVSDDYKERFKAEYFQTKIRYIKLSEFIIKYEAGELNFKPSCSLNLLINQKQCMNNYLNALELRAKIENINLDDLLMK